MANALCDQIQLLALTTLVSDGYAGEGGQFGDGGGGGDNDQQGDDHFHLSYLHYSLS